MVAATSNGVNLTDGLDGLATGPAILALAAYMIMGSGSCERLQVPRPHLLRHPRPAGSRGRRRHRHGRLHRVLWWNAPPAKIFMGDTGSLALGGALAGLAITTRTEPPAAPVRRPVRDHTLSVVIQVGSFKMTGKRDSGGPAAASFRPCRLGGNHDRRPLLDNRRHLHRLGPGHFLRRHEAPCWAISRVPGDQPARPAISRATGPQRVGRVGCGSAGGKPVISLVMAHRS